MTGAADKSGDAESSLIMKKKKEGRGVLDLDGETELLTGQPTAQFTRAGCF